MVEEEKKKKKKKLLLLLLFLLICIGGYFVYDYFKSNTTPATVVAGDFLPDGKDASKMTEKEVANYAQQAVDKSEFNMKIVSKATFSKDTMKGNLAIQNPPNNKQPVNVVVNLNGNGDKVYESGAINPGEEITEATLSKTLSPGTYDATATFNIYNPDTKKKQGQVKSILTLVVE